MQYQNISPEKTAYSLIRLREVMKLTGLSRSSIYKLLEIDPTFPKRVILGQRAMAFVETEVHCWLKSKIDARG